jgi:YtxH-like protein
MAYAGPAKRGNPMMLGALPHSGESSRPPARPLPRSATSTDRSSDPFGLGVFAAGLGLGLLLGAGAALLFAPQSGSDTRHALARRGRRLQRRSRDAWDDLGEELRRVRRRRRANRDARRRSREELSEAS